MSHAEQIFEAPRASWERLPQLIAGVAEPLPGVDEPQFAQAFDRFGGARVVLLGEATQGTSEFYRARAAITRGLIERRGFNVVTLEADHADAQVFDAYVHGGAPPRGGGDPGGRFPIWRWRNAEFLDFLDWLRSYNAGRTQGPKVSIQGLDRYNLAGSTRAAIDYLDRVNPEAAVLARRRFSSQTPWAGGQAAPGHPLTADYARHGSSVILTLSEVLARQAARMAADSVLNADQAARLAGDAAAQYGALYYGRPSGRNLRSAHLLETLDAVLAARGSDARAVVWAHNAEVGDSQATEMDLIGEDLNLGHRCRQVWGDEAVLIGFGTHAGTLACASGWDAPPAVRRLEPPPAGSCEGLAHAAGLPRYLLDLRPGRHDEVRAALAEPRRQRFIGSVYRPETERGSHAAECRLSQQFDAWVWFDETAAVTPLPVPEREEGDEPAVWPFGL